MVDLNVQVSYWPRVGIFGSLVRRLDGFLRVWNRNQKPSGLQIVCIPFLFLLLTPLAWHPKVKYVLFAPYKTVSQDERNLFAADRYSETIFVNILNSQGRGKIIPPQRTIVANPSIQNVLNRIQTHNSVRFFRRSNVSPTRSSWQYVLCGFADPEDGTDYNRFSFAHVFSLFVKKCMLSFFPSSYPIKIYPSGCHSYDDTHANHPNPALVPFRRLPTTPLWMPSESSRPKLSTRRTGCPILLLIRYSLYWVLLVFWWQGSGPRAFCTIPMCKSMSRLVVALCVPSWTRLGGKSKVLSDMEKFRTPVVWTTKKYFVS